MPRVQHSFTSSMSEHITQPPPGQGKGPWLLDQLQSLTRIMKPGELFPSDRALAERYGVARMTVRGQVDELIDHGLLERKPGRGTFVRRPDAMISDIPLSFTAEMKAKGLRPSSRILAFRRTPATAADRRLFQLERGEIVLQIARVRLADDVPMSLERVRLPNLRVPGLTRAKLGHQSLYGLLASDYGIVVDSADQTITVDWPSAHDLALLELPQGLATLHLERVARDNMGRVIEHANSHYRADRYQVQMHVENSRK